MKYLNIWKVMYNPTGYGAIPYYFNDKKEAIKFAKRNYADNPIRVQASKFGDIDIIVYNTVEDAEKDNGYYEYI